MNLPCAKATLLKITSNLPSIMLEWLSVTVRTAGWELGLQICHLSVTPTWALFLCVLPGDEHLLF